MEGVIIMKSLNDNEKKTDSEKENCISWFIVGLFCALYLAVLNIILPFKIAFILSMLTAMVICILVVIW